MKTLLVTFTLMILGYCQLNVTAFSKLPDKTYNSLSFSALRNNNNDVVISGYKNYVYKLIRLNVTNGPTTITQLDYNHTTSRNQAFAYLFFFNGYIMASSTGTTVQVWNQSSLAYLGELQGVSAIGRGQYISYKNVFFYGTSTGNVGYFQVKNMPNITVNSLTNYSSSQFVLPYKSPDEQFVAVSFKFCSDILIYRTSDWVQVKKFKASGFPIYTVCFSPDNRYLMVFIYGSTFVEVYDRDINWTLSANKSVGYNNVRTSFYYEQTNTVVAFSQTSHDVFTVNWYDYTVTKIFTNPDGWKMYRSDSGDSMTIFQQPSASKAWFFNINPYCPAFTVWEIPTKKCVGCPVNCKTCVSSTACSICNANYTLQTNKTCQVCGTGKIYNATSMLCDSCPTNCNVCTSPTVCTTCASGTFLVNSTCVTCPVGNSYNFSSWSCYPNCTANCLTCASSTLCSVCSTNYELTALQKCQACSTGTFYNSSTKKCQTCPTNCTACTSLTSCSSCLSGMFLVNQTCISCPIGNSYNYTSWQCYANCTAKCVTCASATTCSVCVSNYELTGTGTCKVCAVGTFYNSSTLKCDTCPVNCTSCTSLDSCSSCSSGLFLVNATCISCPSNNDYNYTSWQCYETCATNCDLCATNTTCSVCSVNYELNPSGQCDICSEGTFYNSATRTCQSCSLDCLQCSSVSACSVCQPHAFLVNASCITCPVGNDYNFTSYQCYPDCTANCQVCASTTACSVCLSGYQLDLSGICQACGSATFYNSTTLKCQTCSMHCTSCTSAVDCLSCSSDFFLVNASCLSCPTGNTYNYTSWHCQPTCTSNCLTCASASTCSQCQANFQLDWSDQCQPCTQGTFYSPSTFKCQTCPTNCTSCTSASHCLSCATNVFLVNGTCIACPVGNDYNYTSWSCFHNCTENCKTCATINTCSQCSENFELISSGICQACNSSAFYDKSSLICHSCPQNCTSCTSATICLSCSTGVFLVNSSCFSCPIGFTYNYTSQKCEVACVFHCSQCSDDTHCSICQYGYQLQNNTCNQCTKGSYFNSSTKTCESCESNCVECSSLEACNVCTKQTFLFSSSCVSCPIGNTFDYLIQQCKPNCTSNCLECQTQTHCKVCIPDYILQNGSCIINDDDALNNKKSRGRTLYDITMQLTVENQFVAMVNKVPGSRRIFRQLFAFFLNIDHLWLYIYHNRKYGYYVNRLLEAVKNLQQEKWNLVSNQLLNNTFHIDIDPLSEKLNTKLNFTSAKYIEIQDQSTSFFENSLDYFFLNVPLVLLIFFFFKFLFHLLFRFEISKLFREYAFNGYLMLMLVEGNAEEFSYLFFFDCLKLHGGTFQQKFINMMTLMIFIVFVTQLIAGFFLIKSFYDQHAKYFYDNCSNTLEGSTHLLIEYGLLNFMLGTAHITLQKAYNFQLLALLFVEASFISIVTYSLHHNRKTKLYEFRYIEWMNLIASFIRICLIFTYYFDQEFPGKYAPVDQVQMYLIIIYLFNWIIYTVVGYFLTVINLFKFIMQKILSKSQQSVLFDNPYLKRFYNLARRQIKKKNIKIQTMDYSSSKQNDKDTFKLQLCLNAGNNKEEISIVHKIKLYKNDNKKDLTSVSNKKHETNKINFHNPTTISKVSEELEPWKNKIHQRFAKQRKNDTINPLSVQNSKGFKNQGQDHDAKIGIEQINLSRFSNNQISNSLQIKKVTKFSRTENPLFQRKNLHDLTGQSRAKSYYTSELKTTEQNVISKGKPKYREKKVLKDMFKTNQQKDLGEDQADIRPAMF